MKPADLKVTVGSIAPQILQYANIVHYNPNIVHYNPIVDDFQK